MKDNNKALFQLHFSIFLWGFTAILGKLITIGELSLVWWRILFTLVSFILFWKSIKSIIQNFNKQSLYVLITGVVVAIHWLCFYGSIKVGNASIALVCLSTSSVFTSFLEPIITRTQFSWKNLLLGCIVIPGIILIASFETQYIHSIILGILAAFLSSLFGSINKKWVSVKPPIQITVLELSGGFMFLSLILLIYSFLGKTSLQLPKNDDLMYLIILAFGCTTLPFILSLKALQKVSAFTTSLSLNLEPVYGIILSVLLLKEHNQFQKTITIPLIDVEILSFYLGTIIIASAIFLDSILKRNQTVK